MKGRKFVPLVAATALALMAPTSGIPAHADSDRAYVTGMVTDQAGRALAGAWVDLTWCDTVNPGGETPDANGCFDTDALGWGGTDRAGRYTVSLERESIDSRTAPGRAGRWLLQAGAAAFTVSAVVPVSAATGRNTAAPTLALVPVALTPPTSGVALTGLVTDPAGVPLVGAHVDAYDAAGRYVDATSTRADGRYYFTVDNPADYDSPAAYARHNVVGSVRLAFFRAGHVSEWSGNVRAKSRASAVKVAAYGSAAGAVAPTAALNKLGTVTGTVKLPAAGANWRADVTLYDADGTATDWGTTDANGRFSIDAEPGAYSVRADGYRFTTTSTNDTSCPLCVQDVDRFGFVAGYYGDGSSLATAKTLRVASGANASAGTLTLTNALRPVAKPVVKGTLAKGKKLRVSAGTWNRKTDVSVRYTWKVGKVTVGTAPTLKLSKKVFKRVAKKPGKLTVTVTATDNRGELVSGSATIGVKKALAKAAKAAAKSKKAKKSKKSKKAKKR